MADQHMPGAELHLLDDAPMNGDGGSRVIWHITWDKNATASAPADLVPFDDLVSYFVSSGSGAAPHLIWDPFTGRTAQMFSATSRSKSVINAPGGVETNRKGNVCIQIETVFFPYCRVNGRVYATVAETPCVGLDRIMAWLRSWGVPDVWPMGEPTWNSNRNSAIWDTQPGHYGHSQVPENDHTDPGPMPALFTSHVQEDDMPLSPEDLNAIEQRVWGHTETDPDTGRPQYMGTVMAWTDHRHNVIYTQVAASNAAITALVQQLGQTHGVDTATVVAAVQQAIADAVVNVHVDVTNSSKGN